MVFRLIQNPVRLPSGMSVQLRGSPRSPADHHGRQGVIECQRALHRSILRIVLLSEPRDRIHPLLRHKSIKQLILLMLLGQLCPLTYLGHRLGVGVEQADSGTLQRSFRCAIPCASVQPDLDATCDTQSSAHRSWAEKQFPAALRPAPNKCTEYIQTDLTSTFKYS
jgi:hypothetical protein